MLDNNILNQVKSIFASLKSQITFEVIGNKNDEKKDEQLDFLKQYSFNIRKVIC